MSPRFGAAILLVAVVHCELYGARAPRDEWLDSQVNVLPASYPCVVIRPVSPLGNLRAGSRTDKASRRNGDACNRLQAESEAGNSDECGGENSKGAFSSRSSPYHRDRDKWRREAGRRSCHCLEVISKPAGYGIITPWIATAQGRARPGLGRTQHSPMGSHARPAPRPEGFSARWRSARGRAALA